MDLGPDDTETAHKRNTRKNEKKDRNPESPPNDGRRSKREMDRSFPWDTSTMDVSYGVPQDVSMVYLASCAMDSRNDRASTYVRTWRYACTYVYISYGCRYALTSTTIHSYPYRTTTHIPDIYARGILRDFPRAISGLVAEWCVGWPLIIPFKISEFKLKSGFNYISDTAHHIPEFRDS